MDDDCALEEELEQQLVLETEENVRSSVSTTRKRLENARIMAKEGSSGCRSADDVVGGPTTCNKEGELSNRDASLEEDMTTHLLQKLSCAMADNGEWKCFHDINNESQRALAEINETLGTLRQWKRQRNVDLSSAAPADAEGATATASGLPLRNLRPVVVSETKPSAGNHTSCGSVASPTPGIDEDPEARESGSTHKNAVGDKQGRLLLLWKEQHLRAQQAAGRLREQMQRHPSRSTADAQGTPGDVILRIRDLLARGEERGPPSTIKGGGGTDGSGGSNDRVAKLRRDVDGLQMGEWIQDTRSDACDRAQTLAREAGEEVQRGTGSDAVTEIEGELDGFAKELDSLLLRIDDPGGENDEGVGVEGDDDDDDDDEVDFVVRHQHSVSGEEAAPAADAYVGRPVLQ